MRQRNYWNGEEQVEDLEIAEMMNEHFQEVFTRERKWNKEEILGVNSPSLSTSKINVSRQEIMNQLKEFDLSQSQGPGGVANWMLKECR